MPKNNGINMPEVGIEIEDSTVMYKRYDIKAYIIKYLEAVPREDVQGIAKINVYDDSPNHFPKDRAGGYYSPNIFRESAEIDIFLDQTLHYMLFPDRYSGYLSKVSNKIFFFLFGKLFIADTLFHEIGHHRYYTVPSKEHRTEEGAEEFAKRYSNEQLRKIYPLLPTYYDLWNKLYHFTYGKRIKRAKSVESSIPVYNADYFDYVGKTYLKQNEFKQAITAFEHLINKDPAYPNAYFNRGLAKASLGKHLEAIKDFTSAINVNPDQSIAYYNRGFCYQEIGEWLKAINDYTRAIDLAYPYADVYVNRSKCYAALKNDENAEKDLQEAIKRGFEDKKKTVSLNGTQ